MEIGSSGTDGSSVEAIPENDPRQYRRTTHAVWEITLKCNLACGHCGSRAGDKRDDELSTVEALDLVHQMADVGINEVTLIGGEAYLRRDWLEIAREVSKSGMRCTMTTGGYGISAELARRMKDAGIKTVSVSVDGLAKTHDRLRGKLGSWAFCFKAIENLRAAGVSVGTNTQINRRSAHELPLLYEKLRDAGAIAWQIQLTVPMGNAADNDDVLLQPHELLELYPMIAYLFQRGHREGLKVQPGNNIGYFGPYERMLRGHGHSHEYSFFSGCQAGLRTLGIEADGAIKGCPSLPTSAYTGGNIRKKSLREIVTSTPELTFNETQGTERATEHMWGFCKGCEFAEVCRGGCNWTAHVFFDRRGNNPYCHHRALTQAARGVRERFEKEREASGLPFDNGCFALFEDPFDAPLPEDPQRFTLDKVQWPASWLEEDPELPKRLAEERERAIEVYRGRAAR